MATKTFKKTARYVQPAWTRDVVAADGISVDGDFFEANVPILGATIRVKARPTEHLRWRQLTIVTPIYRNGEVSLWVVFLKQWLPLADSEREMEVDLGNRFYGVGLNFFGVTMSVDIPTNANVIYDVTYEVEVFY